MHDKDQNLSDLALFYTIYFGSSLFALGIKYPFKSANAVFVRIYEFWGKEPASP